MIYKLVAIVCLLSLSACGWVDSAGSQTADSTSEGASFDTTVTPIEEGVETSFQESTSSRTLVVSTTTLASDWTWSLQAENAADMCENASGFDSQFAADSLASACTSVNDCDVRILAIENDDQANFTIDVPSLRAPVALRYQLSANSTDGTVVQREQVICAISINESPDTDDDTYRALTGVSRIVIANDSNGLLANDSDDEDVRNSPLSVLPGTVRAPIFASQFSLEEDGSFTYTADESLIIANNETLIDSFTFEVTDGIHTVQSNATILIVNSNSEPQTVGSLPDIMLTRTAEDEAFNQSTDISVFFQDNDNDQLFYSVEVQDLPESVSVEVDDDGVLQLVTSNTAEDITDNAITGTWLVDVTAYDGLATASSAFTLTIENSAEFENHPPVAEQIPDLIARGDFTYSSSRFFSDPDNDDLIYTSQGLPTGVQLSSDGIVTGTSDSGNAGFYNVVITVADPFDATASSAFSLTLN